MIKMREQIKPGETPERITVSMIDQDLKDGISKPEMVIKYGIKPWEVDEMFKHPLLKGRRPSRKKSLSFEFVDDTPEDAGVLDQTKEAVNTRGYVTDTDEPIINPNQVTLEEAIDDAIESATQAQEALTEAVEAVEEIFPTEVTGVPNGDTMSDTDDDDELELPSVEDTLNLVKEQQEEELEMDDDTFEL
jgi:hypothetical protein